MFNVVLIKARYCAASSALEWNIQSWYLCDLVAQTPKGGGGFVPLWRRGDGREGVQVAVVFSTSFRQARTQVEANDMRLSAA